MIRLGLVGYPLAHSLSPRIHAEALEACGLAGEYCLYPVLPNDVRSLQELLGRIRSADLRGLNVTIPHKQNVMQFLDELTSTAQAIGAVNTVFLRHGRLVGENTDAPGFLSDLRCFLTTEPGRRGELKALVLGAGGSARAVVYALLQDGWDVVIAARRPERAKQISEAFTESRLQISSPAPSVNELSSIGLSDIELSNISLIVNTTPIGMTPDTDRSPWPEGVPFPAHAAVYDLVYNPHVTKLVSAARDQGLRATTGQGMLIEQAALSFEIWTGQKPRLSRL